MGEPKHQHYIPKSYLKYFAQKTEKGLYMVDTLLEGENETIKQLTTTNICVQKNIYTFPLNEPGDRFALEKFYAVEVDAVYPEVYAMLTNPNITVINADDKRKILNTLLSLYFRTPKFLNERIATFDRMVDRMATASTDPEAVIKMGQADGTQLEVKIKDLEDFREQRKTKMKQDFLIKHFAAWQEFVKYKMECNIEVITVTDDMPLITCDNPVAVMDMDGQANDGQVFSPHNIIEMPIDPRTYVIIYPNSVSENNRLRISRAKRDKFFAAGVNRSIEKNSDIRLIAFPGDLQKSFDIMAELDKETPENLAEFDKLIQKTIAASELADIIKQQGTSICQPVADKVKEMRQNNLLDDNEYFQMLILALARKGYLTV